jgi:predicted nucleic acid-binding protein
MITAVDTNILLDILIPDSPYLRSSKQLLDEAYREGLIIISEIVYAELAVQFPDPEDIDVFLKDTGIEVLSSSKEVLIAAARAWSSFTKQRKKNLKLQCSICGHEAVITCSECGEQIIARQHILSDFLIGAHAFHNADLLLTRDRRYYQTYFPSLKIKSP